MASVEFSSGDIGLAMKLSAYIGCGLTVLAIPLLAGAASIELLAPDGTCRLGITAAQPAGTFSVVAVGGAEATCCPGFSGAEFRIAGLSGDWVATVTPNPIANVVLGSPLGDGVNIAFGTALGDPSVLLFSISITYLPVGEPPPATLRVVAHNQPSHPSWPCPRVSGGDCPCWAFACAVGGLLYINGDGDCLVGVEPSTWSGVKQLYRQ